MPIERVRKFIETHHLIQRGHRVMVGVSGGPDSVYLLMVLSEIVPLLDGSLHVLHLDHGLRGKESAADADFVSRLASEMNLPCTVERRLVRPNPGDGLSLQEKAREIRMDFFKEKMALFGGHSIALGHTADDRGETILMRLISGGGPGSLAGIRPLGPHGIIHPILDVTRTEILEFLKGRGQDFRTDTSNLADSYQRNRIRRTVLPPILEINPSFTHRLGRLSALLEEEDRCLSLLADQARREASQGQDGEEGLLLQKLIDLPGALKNRVLVAAARGAGVPEKNFRLEHVEALARLLAGPPGKRISLPGRFQAERTYRHLVIRPEIPRDEGFPNREVALPGTTEVPELDLAIIAEEGETAGGLTAGAHPGTALIDAGKISEPLTVRTRKDGDWFRPLGLGHRQKLKKFFIDHKIDRRERDRIPILTDREKIVWVGGMRLDERVKITPDTVKAWRLNIEPHKRTI
jgi:tRNA(Ile)-lysidine synthase